MSNLSKYARLLTKVIEKGAETLENSTKDLSNKVTKEKKKAEIKAQIGQHERQMQKAYERIGRAYFDHVQDGVELPDFKDTFDIINSNEKVIMLLEEQLLQVEDER